MQCAMASKQGYPDNRYYQFPAKSRRVAERLNCLERKMAQEPQVRLAPLDTEHVIQQAGNALPTGEATLAIGKVSRLGTLAKDRAIRWRVPGGRKHLLFHQL